MKIIIDPDKCIGCNLCEDISEGAMGIKFGKEGKADQNPKADLADPKILEKVKLAVETCPMQTITLEE